MTIYGALARLPRALPVWRERWELPDGDFVDVDRMPAISPAADAPLLVVCHGLEGSSEAGYVRQLLACARERGMGAVALNFRGCSGEMNRLPRYYHSGETGDLTHAIERLVREQPGRTLVVAGFSLGGNVVAKYLGEQGDALPSEVRAAAVVCAPLDLALCCDAIDGPGVGAFIYRQRFLRRLRAKALAKAARFPRAIDVAGARRARTLRGFDDVVTAPLHGFTGAADYYARASAGPLMGRIRCRTLILMAEDDPLIPIAVVPRDVGKNPALVLETHARGGHVAFVEGAPWSPRYFGEARVADFLAQAVRP
jgi:uncharacterized protein